MNENIINIDSDTYKKMILTVISNFVSIWNEFMILNTLYWYYLFRKYIFGLHRSYNKLRNKDVYIFVYEVFSKKVISDVAWNNI